MWEWLLQEDRAILMLAKANTMAHARIAAKGPITKNGRSRQT